MQRWPAFAPAALAVGVSAVFAFPLVMGAIAVGALEIHRGREGELSAGELAEALLFADRGPSGHRDGFGAARQRLDRGVLRLRAHAYLTGSRLSQVAREVVERRLRFDPDTDNAGAAGSGG